ncbi:hypothetical protein QE450_004471 [Paenibacillus sp. SORGH_AS306]|uniref:S-layer homology domain-containing protein n=1 Tax=unclassified Paenibacillus TaxID=185978 RepID=UPI002781EFE3|nr:MULTISPECIES: S-layer homology domain-containing protein [unclassified Paenibacillus]MDQ1236973.1 hypothetical protein [Paenibacillus sp. SORGH_AS_0306]MDR6109334.1 hypothetical protein [Paenibacillus sp. SORGH_AS_0338]
MNNKTNKMNKKIVTSILSASILSISLGSVSFAATTSSFQDLKGVNGQDKIVKLHDQHILNGLSDTAFAPQSSLTQAQAIQFIVKGFKLDAKTGVIALKDNQKLSTVFPSVKDNAWYTDAFRDAYKNGVDIPKSVNPTTKITREQYIDYVMTALQTVGKMPAIDVITPDIKDIDKLDPAMLDSSQLAIALGIVKLDSSKNLYPQKEITRAEAAVILYDALDYLNKSAQDKMKGQQTTIDVLPHEEKGSNPVTQPNNGSMVSESYATPTNGEKLYVRAVKMALDQHAGQDVKYFVAIDLFSNGTPLATNSKEVQAEVKRLQGLNYDIDFAKAWTYEGNLQKVDYTYVGAYLTADQLQQFKANTNYGYAFQFASNGDGSPVQGKAGSISGVSDNSNIAD